MNHLKKGLINAFRAIKKRKLTFTALILLQIIFIALFIFISLTYQIKVFKNAQGIMEPLQNANYDAESIKEGQPLTNDVMQIYKSYKSMIQNLTEMILWLFLAFILINGSIWILTHQLLERKKSLRKTAEAGLKFVVSSLVLIVPYAIIGYFLLKTLLKAGVATDSFAWIVRILAYLFLVTYYFLLAAFAFIDVKSWKVFLRRIFFVSIKKIHHTLLVLLINLILILIGLYLVYLSMNTQTLILMILTVLLFVVVLVLTRIYWVACLKEISRDYQSKEKN